MSKRRHATEALVLSVHEYSESSQTARLLTPDLGRISVLAKGIRKPNAYLRGPIDHLQRAEIEILHDPRKDLQLLTRYRVVTGHPRLRSDLPALLTAFFVTEVLREGTRENLPDPGVHALGASALAAIEAAGAVDALALGAWFGLSFLELGGVLPRFSTCVSCEREAPERGPVRFAPALGGLLCRRCAPGQTVRLLTIAPAVRRWLAVLPGASPVLVRTLRAEDASGLVAAWSLTRNLLQGLMERELRSATLVGTIGDGTQGERATN